MLGNLTGWHFLIVVLVVLLLFGATKLPALARSVGQSAKILKREIKDVSADPPGSDEEDGRAGDTSPSRDNAAQG
jgi:sec-independent protein translocase protein TatA